jgi:phage baseplate assembly protein W
VHTRSSKLFVYLSDEMKLLAEQLRLLTLSPTLTELTNGRMAEATPRMEARLTMRMVTINDVDGWMDLCCEAHLKGVPATHGEKA